MKQFNPTVYMSSLRAAQTRDIDLDRAERFTQRITAEDFCTTRQATAWRIVNRAECPLRVQLEFLEENGRTEMTVVPLSAYTDTLDTQYPLKDAGVPHTVTVPFNSDSDIENAIKAVQECFPRYAD